MCVISGFNKGKYGIGDSKIGCVSVTFNSILVKNCCVCGIVVENFLVLVNSSGTCGVWVNSRSVFVACYLCVVCLCDNALNPYFRFLYSVNFIWSSSFIFFFIYSYMYLASYTNMKPIYLPC